MDERLAVHTLARRYCMEQYADRVDRRERNRYLAVEAILRAIESLRPETAASVEALVESLVEASRAAQSTWMPSPPNEVETLATESERESFVHYVRTIKPRHLASVEPLPYRRTLGKEKSERLWAALAAKWDVGGGYWHPLKIGGIPPNVLCFHTDYFDDTKVGFLLEALSGRCIRHVLELREWREGECELEVSEFEPYYSGQEGYWTSTELDWLVYASHESSITLAGGWLVDLFRAAFPGGDLLQYEGPYSTADKRGSGVWDPSR